MIRCGSFFFLAVVFFVFAFTTFFRFFFVGDDDDGDDDDEEEEEEEDSSPSLWRSSLPLEVSSSDVSPDADDDPFVLVFLFLVFAVAPFVVFFVVVDDPLTLDERSFTAFT